MKALAQHRFLLTVQTQLRLQWSLARSLLMRLTWWGNNIGGIYKFILYFRYLKWFARPVNLSPIAQLRINELRIIKVIYDLGNDEDGQSIGHLSFNLAPRVYGIDEVKPYDSQVLAQDFLVTGNALIMIIIAPVLHGRAVHVSFRVPHVHVSQWLRVTTAPSRTSE